MGLKRMVEGCTPPATNHDDWQRSRETQKWRGLPPKAAAAIVKDAYAARAEEETILRAMLAARDGKPAEAQFWAACHGSLEDKARAEFASA